MKCGDEKTKQVFTLHNISDLSLCWSLTQLVFCCNFTNKKCLSNYSLSIPMCEKGFEKSCQYWCEKARKHMCVTDRHDMILAVKVALNPNTTTKYNLAK